MPFRHLALALIGNAALIVALSGYLDYRAGAHNTDGGFATFRSMLALIAVWLTCLSIQTVTLLRAKPNTLTRAARTLCILLTLATMATCPFSCAFRILPDVAYVRGFRQWTLNNVNIPALRAYHATLPATSTTTSIPPSA